MREVRVLGGVRAVLNFTHASRDSRLRTTSNLELANALKQKKHTWIVNSASLILSEMVADMEPVDSSF
jgi:hypothetical protein